MRISQAYRSHSVALAFLATLWIACGLSLAQEEKQNDLSLRDFRPVPKLKVKHHDLQQAKFPVIDIHSHFRYRLRHSPEKLKDYLAVMKRNNIAMCVSLDGRLSDELEEHKKYLWTHHRTRFGIFVNIDWRGNGKEDDPKTWACHRDDFVRTTVESLRAAKQQGAIGVKIFKRFGLSYRNPNGSLMRIDDTRWDPIWRVCGELGFPVIIHTADPAAFFDRIDETNERWEELSRHPDWSFPSDKFPSREQLLKMRNTVIGRHSKTKFIGAHVANNPEDLETVALWLKKYPNLYVEIASRIGELGRQPYTARKFFIAHADRILFGTDGPWPEKRLRLYWRFLETFDEYIPYSEKPFPPQGFWRIYGIGLPDDVLRKVYHENALKLLPALRPDFEKIRTN